MSYAIGYIIYGVPLNESISDYLYEQEKLEDFDIEEHFDTRYSGSGDTPGWCGVQLDRIDECGNFPISSVRMKPTEQEMQQAQEKIDKLPPEIKSLLDPVDVYIVWGSS